MKQSPKILHGRPSGRRFRAAALLFLLLVCVLTACGKKDPAEPVQNSETDAETGTEEYIYVSEEVPTPESDIYPYSFQSDGTYLYYTMNNTIYRIPLDGELSFENRELFCRKPASDILAGYALDSEGNLYSYLQSTAIGKDYNLVYRGGTLVKRAPGGDKVYELNLPEVNTMSTSACVAADGEGRAFILAEDGIHVIGADGSPLSQISTEGSKPQGQQGREEIIEGADGRIYYLVYDGYSSPPNVYEITGDGVLQLTRRDEIMNTMSNTYLTCFNGGRSYGPLCEDGGILWQYDETDGAWSELFCFADSSLPTGASEVVRLTEDTLFAYYYSFGTVSSNPVCFLLKKTPASEVPKKEKLVLATTDPWSNLPAAVASFNRANDRYQVILEVYEGEEGLMRLDSALVSDNPPDMLDLWGLSLTKYAGKQAFVDLTPYLENSDVLSREDFLENLLEGYTIDGRLCCIPSTFNLELVVGRSSQVGDTAGWTMEDVMALTQRYPDSKLLGRSNFEYALNFFCGDYIMERFVDWDAGSCSFDSPEFITLLKWMQAHTKGVYLTYVEGEDYDGDAVPKDMLLHRDVLPSPRHFVMDTFYWDEPITLIGAPTVDGRPRYTATASEAVCILSVSDNPDGAWEFLEYFLSEREYDPFTFSCRKDFLYRSVEEETVPNYERDENGEIIIYEHFSALENGGWVEHWNEPMMLWRSAIPVNGEQMYYYYMEQETADLLLDILENLDFTPEQNFQDEIINIIMEEMAPCLTGGKTIETAADIIQNRVRTLIQENL